MSSPQLLADVNKIDIFAEHNILRALIAQPEFLEDQRINEGLFNFKKTKSVFQSIQELVDSKSEINAESLITKFISKDMDYNRSTIDELYSIPYTQKADLNALIDQLKDCQKRRLTIQNLDAAMAKIREASVLDENTVKEVKDLIGEAESSIAGVETSVNTVYTLPQWTDAYLEKTKHRRNGKQFQFYSFLDRLVTDGPTPGDFGLIASRSGSGKSALCLGLISTLINREVPCMYFSLEMGLINTMDRLMAIRTDYPYQAFAHPEDSDEFDQMRSLIEAEKKILDDNKNFRFSESPSLSLADIKKLVKKFQQDIGQTYCIVFIDLLSMVSDFTKNVSGQNSAFTMEQGVNKLSAMCKELGIHAVGVVQLNRGADEKVNDLEDIKKLRPTINQIKNAKAFEERARWVIGTHRTKHYVDQFLKELTEEDKKELMTEFVDEKTGSDLMEVMVLKQNSGELGKLNVWFNGPTFKINCIDETNEETGEET